MDGGPCIRMENADDPRFALNADDLGIIPVLSESVDMAEENLKIVSIVGFGGIGKTTLAKSQHRQLPPLLLGSSDELSDGSAHPGALLLQKATPIEGDGDSLKDSFEAMWELRKYILLLATFVATVTYRYQGRFNSRTESEHSSALLLVVGVSLEIYLGGYVSPFVVLLQENKRLVCHNHILGFSPLVDNLFLEIALAAYLGGYSTIGELLKQKISSLGGLVLGIALAAYLGGYSTIGESLKEKIRRRIAGNDCPVLLNGERSNRSESQAGIWIMDSGAQCHATGDLRLFSFFLGGIMRLFSGHLNMTKPGSWIYGVSGHEHPLPIRGVGTVQFAHFRLLLLAILVATLTYQAGMNPPEGFWSGTESEHSRIKGSNELKDVVRSQTLLSGTLAIALLFTLLDLFKAIGIPPKAKETGASKGYESTSMGSYTEYDPENSSGSNSMVAKDNAVAETVATWEVGSASTHHATGNRALLSDFITVDDLNILTGDGIIMPVSGRGSVITDTVVLHDVWFVPGLKKNVVSVSQLAELDCSIVFKRDACYISGATDGTIIGKALVGENGMFKLEFLKVPLVN